MKKGRAVSTTVAAVVVIVIVAAAGGAYYYYAQVSTTPQKTIGVVFDIGGRGVPHVLHTGALGPRQTSTAAPGSAHHPRALRQLCRRGATAAPPPHLQHLGSFAPPPVH